MGKTYVVTGSTSGIGKAVVEALAKDSENRIFAGYRNETKINKDLPENVEYFYIDMLNSTTIKNASEFIKSKTQHIDTLINVAGNVTAGPIEKIAINRLKDQFNVNTFSHIELTQNLIDLLHNSKIINISSMASYGIFPFISPYCASKRALDILFNALYLENHKNLKIISLKLGVVSTPIWETSVQSNIDYLSGDKEYSTELEYIKNNALKNTNKGLKAENVAKFIKKIDKLKAPKTSYVLGKDAKFTQFLSIIPQDTLNKILKYGMKFRINKNGNEHKTL